MKSKRILAIAAFMALLPVGAEARDAAVGTSTLVAAAGAIPPNRFVWEDDSLAAAPVAVVISRSDQRAYVYRGETLVAVSAVSTGKEGKETPVGVFSILQKKEEHRSNLYDDASMPYMQRLTWDGVAMHAGRNPGFPASHGCIRMPSAFAKKLYDVTQLGAKVIVVDEPIDGESFGTEIATYVTEDAAATAEANRIAAEFAAR